MPTSATRMIVYVTLFLCLTGSISCTSKRAASPIHAQDNDSNTLKYEIKEAFVGGLQQKVLLTNPTAHKIMGGKLFIPLVTNKTALHYVLLRNIISTIGQPTILRDDSENTCAYWHDIVMERNAEIAIEVNYDVLSFTTGFLVSASQIPSYNSSSDLYKRYTQPEELVQSDEQAIVSAALDITRNVSSVHQKVARIYDFVIKHVRYAAQDYEKGALWALENKTGDCSEYSYLFVALCRVAGIPARIQTGFGFSLVGETVENGHMWAEYYLEEYGWTPVDATWKLFDRLDFRHFNSLQSVSDQIPYSNVFFNYTSGPDEQYVEQEQSVSLKTRSSNVFSGFPLGNVTKAIGKLGEAKLVLSLAKTLGAYVLASSAIETTQRKLVESETQLQGVIETFQSDSQAAQSCATDAATSADEALDEALKLVAFLGALFFATLVSTVLVVLFLLNRYHHRMPKKNLATDVTLPQSACVARVNSVYTLSMAMETGAEYLQLYILL